jgi:hypothetical protein
VRLSNPTYLPFLHVGERVAGREEIMASDGLRTESSEDGKIILERNFVNGESNHFFGRSSLKLTETKQGEYEGVCLNSKDIPLFLSFINGNRK